MCKRNAESTDHLLLHCQAASELWSLVFFIFGVQWVMSGSIKELFECWSQVGCRGRQRLGWKVVPLCLFWCIWREKNLRAFVSLIFLKTSFLSSFPIFVVEEGLAPCSIQFDRFWGGSVLPYIVGVVWAFCQRVAPLSALFSLYQYLFIKKKKKLKKIIFHTTYTLKKYQIRSFHYPMSIGIQKQQTSVGERTLTEGRRQAMLK